MKKKISTKDLMEKYNKIINSEKLKLIPDEKGINKLVKEFRDELKQKGYVGVRRFGKVGKDTAEYETMFFEKPKSMENIGLKKNFQMSAAYHRLMDLSNVLHNARTLLDRIHLEHEYNKQEAYRDLIDHLLKRADSNITATAKPDNVIEYLRKRIRK